MTSIYNIIFSSCITYIKCSSEKDCFVENYALKLCEIFLWKYSLEGVCVTMGKECLSKNYTICGVY